MVTRTWCVVVVRAWHDDDGLKIRLLLSGTLGQQAVLATSADAAGQRLTEWLSTMSTDPPSDAGEDPGTTRA